MGRLKLTHLKAFCEVADGLSVTLAASRLFRTQPAVSRQLAELETALGVSLFLRKGRSLLLTPEGQDLRPRAMALVTAAIDMEARAQQLADGSAATLRIGAMTASLEGVLPAVMARYRTLWPHVVVRFTDVDTRDLLPQVESGEIDLAFGRDVSNDAVASSRLFPMSLVALVAKGHPLAKQAQIEVAALERAPLLLTPTGTGSRTLLEQACRAEGLTLRDIRMESRAYSSLLAMTEAGYGVAIVLSTIASARPTMPVLPVTHRGEPLRVWFSGLWHRRRALPPYAKAFVEIAEQFSRDEYPGRQYESLRTTRRKKR